MNLDWPVGDMNKLFVVVGVKCLVAGAVWLWGMRYLARDTVMPPRRLEAARG